MPNSIDFYKGSFLHAILVRIVVPRYNFLYKWKLIHLYLIHWQFYASWKYSQKQPLEVSHKKGVLRNFTKFTGKHLCQSLFFNKVAGLRPATLLKKWLWYRCFPVNFVKFPRTPFFKEHLRWLLLYSIYKYPLSFEMYVYGFMVPIV